jgi:hypothetical protein
LPLEHQAESLLVGHEAALILPSAALPLFRHRIALLAAASRCSMPQYSKSGQFDQSCARVEHRICQPAPSNVNRVNLLTCTCLRVNPGKPYFSRCAAGGLSRGCPPRGFFRPEGPAKPLGCREWPTPRRCNAVEPSAETQMAHAAGVVLARAKRQQFEGGVHNEGSRKWPIEARTDPWSHITPRQRRGVDRNGRHVCSVRGNRVPYRAAMSPTHRTRTRRALPGK